MSPGGAATLLDDELARELAADAALAPSVHNVQPARWAARAPDTLVLLRAVDRVLPVADPAGRDVRVSLGAALEGMALAASLRGLALRDVRWDDAARAALGAASIGGHEVVAAARVTMGGVPDRLAAHVRARRSWRGAFEGAAAAAKVLVRLHADDVAVLPASAADDVARWVEDATWAFERRADYHAERWAWLRLDPSDPRYRRDGLTAESLLLSPLERRLARVALRPAVFRALQVTGVGRSIVSEAAAVRTAAGFVCLCPSRDLDDYALGRRFYRLWLQATAAGLALAPMSVLADHEPTCRAIAARVALAPDRRLATVLRAGKAPPHAPPASPRLPLEELFVG